jgi:RNA polymerase sigma-70 factor (ECF subfamily)
MNAMIHSVESGGVVRRASAAPAGATRSRLARKKKQAARVAPALKESQLKPAPTLDETVRRAQRGDADAFEALYRLHSRRVYALCLRMLGDPVEAEDLTQEAFMQLFRKIHTFRGESAFSSWLHRLTANVVLMRFRRKRPVPASLDETSQDDDSRPALEIGVPDLRLMGVFDRVNLQAAVARLPEGYKSMFLLHDVHGYEHNEIAQLLGCSIGNSKSQLHKARKRLRELLHGVRHYASGQGRDTFRTALATAG